MSEQLKFNIYEQELLNPLRGHKLSDMESYIASLLLTADTHRPIGIAEIMRSVESSLNVRINERLVKRVIRTLRKDHAFPILARKKQPSGYWWCGGISEMEAFIESFRKQALDELHTLSKIVTRNYPALQGQLRFDDVS